MQRERDRYSSSSHRDRDRYPRDYRSDIRELQHQWDRVRKLR